MKGGAKLIIRGNNGQSLQSLSLVFNLNLCDFFLVSKKEFESKYTNNPLNLLSQINYRNTPQPRYKLHPEHSSLIPESKYLLFKRCLPGSYVASTKPSDAIIYRKSGNGNGKKVNNHIYHTSCVAYDVPRSHNSTAACQSPSSDKSTSQSMKAPGEDSLNRGRILIFLS